MTLSARGQQAATGKLTDRAGWAEIEITPPLGIALGGRGGTITPARQILDPLMAQVLFVRDAKDAGFVLVSLDLVGLSHELSDRLQLAIVHELGVDRGLVVLNCSHTHSGPLTIRSLMAGASLAPPIEIEYFDALVEKIVQTCRLAKARLKPVEVEVFEGKSRMAFNRRGKNRQGTRGIIPDPDGPIDETVWVMKLSPRDGSAPAVVFSYACHPVLVYSFAYAAISADFPGVTRGALREELGTNAHIQFVQALAGDVRPRVVADLENNRFRSARPEDVKAAGKELANDIMSAIKTGGRKLTLDLAGAADRPALPRGKPPPRELYEKKAASSNGFDRAVGEYWLKRYDSGEGFARAEPWPVGLIRLSEQHWIVYFAGEPCVGWGPKVKQWLAPRDVVVWGYCQNAITYLPTEEMLSEGGYEVEVSNHNRASSPAPFAPGIDAAVRESLLRQSAFIRAKVTDTKGKE